MGGYTYSAGFGERDAWFMTPLFDADSGGTGIETVAAAGMLYQRAKAQDLGSTISFAPASTTLSGT